MISVKMMADSNNNPVKCPFCGSENPVGSAFCQDCGKKFMGEQLASVTATNQSYQSLPMPGTNYQPAKIGVLTVHAISQ